MNEHYIVYNQIGALIRSYLPKAVIVRIGNSINVFADRMLLFVLSLEGTQYLIKSNGENTLLPYDPAIPLRELNKWIRDFQTRVENQYLALGEAIGYGHPTDSVPPKPFILDSLLTLTEPLLGTRKQGRLVVLGGSSNTGKTTWLLQLIRDYLQGDGNSVRFWNRETKPELLAKKMIDMPYIPVEHAFGEELHVFLTQDAKTYALEVLDGHIVPEMIPALKQKALRCNCDIVVSMQAPQVQGLDALLWAGRDADMVLWTTGIGLPLEIIKDRDGLCGLIWASVPTLEELLDA